MANFYLRQLLVGRDIGRDDYVGGQMQNFVYLLGDRDARECVIVDPAWDIRGVLARAAEDDMKVVGALATHYHPDHVGGSMFGFDVQGLPTLMELSPCHVHVQEPEGDGLLVVTGLSESDLVRHHGGDRITVGGIEIELLHTPGHTPGSQCFRVKDALVSGDTLFLQGCGRVDLPGGSVDEMERTLTERFAQLPDELVLYPGHAYGGEHAPLGEVRRTNPFLRGDLRRWLGG